MSSDKPSDKIIPQSPNKTAMTEDKSAVEPSASAFAFPFFDIEPPAAVKKQEPRKTFWEKYKDIWIPLASLLVALITILNSTWMQHQNNNLQLQMKAYDLRVKDFELNFKTKQDAYIALMIGINQSFETAHQLGHEKFTNGNKAEWKTNAYQKLYAKNTEVLIAFYRMEPFLTVDSRTEVRKAMAELQGLGFMMVMGGKPPSPPTILWDGEYLEQFAALHERFRNSIYPSLFPPETRSISP